MATTKLNFVLPATKLGPYQSKAEKAEVTTSLKN